MKCLAAAEVDVMCSVISLGLVVDFEKRSVAFFVNRKLVGSCPLAQEVEALYLNTRVVSRYNQECRMCVCIHLVNSHIGDMTLSHI
jgi:hypothetical protein